MLESQGFGSSKIKFIKEDGPKAVFFYVIIITLLSIKITKHFLQSKGAVLDA